MMLEPDERRFDFSRTIGHISRFDFLIGADVEGKFVGFLSAKRGNANRIRNTAYVVVGIIEEFQHQGIGAQFLQNLIDGLKKRNKTFRADRND